MYMESTIVMYLDVFHISIHNIYCSLIQKSTSDVHDQEVNVKGLPKSFYLSFEYQMIS